MRIPITSPAWPKPLALEPRTSRGWSLGIFEHSTPLIPLHSQATLREGLEVLMTPRKLETAARPEEDPGSPAPASTRPLYFLPPGLHSLGLPTLDDGLLVSGAQAGLGFQLHSFSGLSDV